MIACNDIVIHQGAFTLGPLSLQLEAQKYHVLMGPSGSGKTTFIEGLLGLRSLAGGRIMLDEDITKADPARRQIGYVPQDAVMFPNMTVQEQLAYGLRLRRFAPHMYVDYLRGRGSSGAAGDQYLGRKPHIFRRWALKKHWLHHRTIDLARQLGLVHLLNRYPQGLSGGERQRVALGRALAIQPRILLLDEPLAALDEANRQGMIRLLGELRHQHQMIILHVTHANSEAQALADNIIRLKQGQVAASGQ